MSVRVTDIEDENELQTLLFKNPEAIEQGMKFIAKEVGAHNKRRIDLLGHDAKGSLVIVELKIEAGEGLLTQILDYADFAYRHFRVLIERFPKLQVKKRFDPNDDIRLIVVAKGFDEIFRRVVPHVEWEIELFKFQAFETKDGLKALVCVQEGVPNLPHLPREKPKTELDYLDYITDDDAREAANSLLKYLESFEDVSMSLTQDYIGFKRRRNFAAIYPRRKNCLLWYRDAKHDWEIRITSIEDIDGELKDNLKAAYESSV